MIQLTFCRFSVPHSKKTILCASALGGLLIATGLIAAARRSDASLPPPKPGWALTFDDEFNGSKLDTTRWLDRYPEGRTHGNQELQYYAPDGYQVIRGALHLNAERRTLECHQYTSGMIASFGKFAQEYGWFEIRARFPKGKGMWPAFWLLPTTRAWPPEIDVLEILGHQPDTDYMSTHWRDENGRHQYHTESWKGPDFSAGFHTFAIDWEPDQITWYIDGEVRCRSNQGVPHEPMYLLANLAVGGDWPGNPDASTHFPASMDIDYIRVYSKAVAR